MSIKESNIKKYKDTSILNRLLEVTKQDVKDAVEDKILDPINAYPNREPSKISNSKNDAFSITVKPQDATKGRETLKKDSLQVNLNQDDGKEENYPILLDIKDSKKNQVRDEGIPLSSGDISNTTPVALATFQEIPFDKESIFNVVLGFKDEKSMTGSTQATEEFLSAALCICLNENLKFDEDIKSAIEIVHNNVEIPKMTDDIYENWEESFQKTLKALMTNNLFDEDKYVVCREDAIFVYENGTGNVIRTNKFDNCKSIHTFIDDTVKIRKDLFSNIKNFKKDSWNPSDIYVIKETMYKKFFESWKNDLDNTVNITNIIDLNLKLKGYILDKSVIGISLKKISSEPHVEEENLNDIVYDNENGKNWRSRKFVIPDNLSFFVPELDILDERNPNQKTRSGIYFKVKTTSAQNIHDIVDLTKPENMEKKRAPNVTFYYRRFTSSPTMILEPINENSDARVGKASTTLMTDFTRMTNDEMDSKGLPRVNDTIHTGKKLKEYLDNETKKLFSREDVDYSKKMGYILSEKCGFRLYTPGKDGEIIRNENWDAFIEKVINSEIIEREQKLESQAYIKLRDWVSIINLLYVLAYLKSQGTLDDDIALLYDWSKKIGSRFAPYILVS